VTVQTVSHGSLREEHRDVTRGILLDAVVAIASEDVGALTVDAVARRAGVSRPTVYRYFKGKREMLDAVAAEYARRIGVPSKMHYATIDEALEAVPAIFARAASIDPIFRAAVWSTRAPRRSASQRRARLEGHRRMLAGRARSLSAADAERLAQLTLLLMSSGMLRLCDEYLGLDADAAAELVQWAIRRLLDGPAGTRGGKKR
jgi:AcrR family transcriptional regulator